VLGPQYQFARWVGAVPPLAPTTFALNLNGKVVPVQVESRGEDQGWVGVRAFGAVLGRAVTWDAEAQAVRLNGTLLPVELAVENGTAKVHIRALVEALGGKVSFDPKTKTVFVTVAVRL
jgi:hypothetical protein